MIAGQNSHGALQLAGERLICLWQRMLWWPAEQTLFVADVHLGKAASFRAAGIALPSGHSSVDLDRISSLLVEYAATRLVILGDLVHARTSYTEALDRHFGAFRLRHPNVEIT